MKSSTKVFALLAMTAVMSLFAMPQDWKLALPDLGGIKQTLVNQDLHLGLDLQGGTQLDYILDLRKVDEANSDEDPENDINRDQIIEGVRTTIERRVNGLGVSEPNIYTASIANEEHIIVELAGIDDIAKAKATVGKTVQLEFKEQKTEIDANDKENIQAAANITLSEAKTTDNFSLLGLKVKTNDGKIEYETFTQFEDEINADYKDALWNASAGTVLPRLQEISDGFSFTEFGQVQEKKGFIIVKAGEKQNVERTKTVPGTDFAELAKSRLEAFEDKNVKLDYFATDLQDTIDALSIGEVSEPIELNDKFLVVKLADKQIGKEEVHARHILVSYEGADKSIQTRTKEEAKARAEEVLAKALATPGKFEELAGEYSDGPSAPQGGDLGFFGKGQMTANFETAVFDLKDEQVSDIVETEFGFHIIQKLESRMTDTLYTTQKLVVEKTEENAKDVVADLRAQTQSKEVTDNEDQLTYERIFYSTLPDPWQATGLDGSKFVRATVTFDQFGKPLVAIDFNTEGAQMFADLTEKNVGKPIAIFVGGVLVSAPTVNEKISGGSAQISGRFTIPEVASLAQDLNTGAISAPITLVGQHQIGATLGEDSLNKSILAGLAGLFLLALYMVFQYRVFGLVANIALAIYAIILLFILKSSGVVGMPIVLTLAGVAGLILSIGMAVDANILIFERVKEEIAAGQKMSAAISIGFDRAWSSIRDSNVSSLITCIILAWFGSSIIRGFAINLGIGIIVSMFTAITVTRTFLYYFFTQQGRGNKKFVSGK